MVNPINEHDFLQTISSDLAEYYKKSVAQFELGLIWCSDQLKGEKTIAKSIGNCRPSLIKFGSQSITVRLLEIAKLVLKIFGVTHQTSAA